MYSNRKGGIEHDNERDRLLTAMGDFVHGLAPWDTYGTFTFEKERSIEHGWKYFHRTMTRDFPGVSFFGAVERNPDTLGLNPGCHIHALLVDLPCKRSVMWADWKKRWGNSRILPIVPREHKVEVVTKAAGEEFWSDPHYIKISDEGITVADYCAKYVCKASAWWDFRLTSWRRPSTEQANLVLLP